jgi:CRISPR-associated protein Csm3
MENQYRKLKGKIQIMGDLECLTGLHIGASKENIEIGALDSPVVRDPITREPYIPGSSIKGKLRTLLEKASPNLLPNRNGGTERNPVMRHECSDVDPAGSTPGAKNCPVCRLFGSTGPGERNQNYPARIKVRDLSLTNRQDLEKIDTGLFLTEWKFENGIDRITSAANPRNIERVPKGAIFSFSLIYDVEDAEEIKPDLENLNLAIRLLDEDSLGGHGSRGYGHVKITPKNIEGRLTDFYRGMPETKLSVQTLSEDDIHKLKAFFASQGG